MWFYSAGYSDTFVRLLAAAACKRQMGNSEMPSVGLDQFLTSTLLALLLLMTVPATLADPTGATIDATKRAQETRRSLAETGSEHATTQPPHLNKEAEKPSPPTMAPTELTIPDEFTEQRSDAPSNSSRTDINTQSESAARRG